MLVYERMQLNSHPALQLPMEGLSMLYILNQLKGHNRQHSGQMIKMLQTEKTVEIQPARPTEVCG